MGTRGLLGVIINGQRYAAYNHYDSYPQSLGSAILKFLIALTPEEWEQLSKNFHLLEWVDEESKCPTEIYEKYFELGYVDLSVSAKDREDWYCVLRNVQGAKALPEILKGSLGHLIERVKFLDNAVFCEWAYFIDFDKKTFETWARGQFLGKVSLEGLDDKGKDKYLGEMIRLERKRSGYEESEEEEEEEDSKGGNEGVKTATATDGGTS